jgi:hypothetical protein
VPDTAAGDDAEAEPDALDDDMEGDDEDLEMLEDDEEEE